MNVIERLNGSNKKIDVALNKLELINEMFLKDYNMVVEPRNGGFICDGSVEIKTVFENEETTVAWGIWYKINVTYQRHCHKDSIECLMVIKGSFIVRIGDASRIMKKGDIASIPVGEIHSVTSLEAESQMLAICVPPEKAYQK